MVDVEQDDFGLALLDDLGSVSLDRLDPFSEARQVLDGKYVPLGFQRTLEGSVTVYSGPGGNKVSGETSVRFWIERGTPRYEIVRSASWSDDPERRGSRQLRLWSERSSDLKLPDLVRDLESWHDNRYSAAEVQDDLDSYAFLDRKHGELYEGTADHKGRSIAVRVNLEASLVSATITMSPQE